MLKIEIIAEMRKNAPLRKALMDANEINSEKTYYNWIKKRSVKLEKPDNLKIISLYTRIFIKDMIEPIEEVI